MNKPPNYIMICQHSSCKAAGSEKILFGFQVADLPANTIVMSTGCQGQCSSGPTVRILPEETWYCRVKVTDIPVIVEEHLRQGKPVKDKLNPRIHQFDFDDIES
jgi:(2Fe-2S) ferredoxin